MPRNDFSPGATPEASAAADDAALTFGRLLTGDLLFNWGRPRTCREHQT